MRFAEEFDQTASESYEQGADGIAQNCKPHVAQGLGCCYACKGKIAHIRNGVFKAGQDKGRNTEQYADGGLFLAEDCHRYVHKHATTNRAQQGLHGGLQKFCANCGFCGLAKAWYGIRYGKRHQYANGITQ